MSPLQERVAKILTEQKIKPVELARVAGVTKGLVSQWIGGERKAMGYDAAQRINRRYGYAIDWLIKGADPKVAAEAPKAAYAAAEEELPAREQILLHLYRGLFRLQQERLVASLWALFEANQITRKELGQKPLRGVSDEDVRRAFGDAPFHAIRKAKRAKRPSPDRDLGDAMGDFLE